MDKQAIKVVLKKIFKKHFLLKFHFLNNNLHLADMGLNPLEKLELIFYLEEKFKISVEDQEIDQLHTVGDLIRCIEKYTSSSYALV